MNESVWTPASLYEMCSKHISYREIIYCGETQIKSGVENRPLKADSYYAIAELSQALLDPLIDQYGKIILTYGFCSNALSKLIKGRIYPSLDQHAAHEVNSKGKLICERLGAAVDFFVPQTSSRDVANWIIFNLHFDRLYFYGDDKPLHISYGPDHKREVVEMRRGPSGRLTPRRHRAGLPRNIA